MFSEKCFASAREYTRVRIFHLRRRKKERKKERKRNKLFLAKSFETLKNAYKIEGFVLYFYFN